MADAAGETPNAGGGPSHGAAGPQQGSAINRVMSHMQASKIDAALWCCRMFTIVCSFLFFLPIFGYNPHSLYQRVLLANAATSALRLHQRLPNFQFNREFFGLLLLEDSAHYLFYSLIFVMSFPLTIALVPVFLFALLHATSYSKALLNQVGPDSLQIVRNLITKLELQQRTILRFIACTEVFMMPMIIFMLFTGRGTLFQPFVYYRFLSLRYSSRRNPYCRQVFYELRVTTFHLISKPQCPAMVRNLANKAIEFISRMAPQVPT